MAAKKDRVLWADDEIDLLKPHILFLQDKGYEVIPVISGQDAIDCCREQSFDIIFLDENMPGLTGLETAEYLAAKGNEVTVIEMAPAVGTAMYRSVTAAVVGNIEKDGGHIMTSHMFKGVKDGAVVVNSLASGYDLDVPADACVIAMGVHPDETIADAFEAAFDRVAVVGDTANPGNIADATSSGYAKAFVF